MRTPRLRHVVLVTCATWLISACGSTESEPGGSGDPHTTGGQSPGGGGTSSGGSPDEASSGGSPDETSSGGNTSSGGSAGAAGGPAMGGDGGATDEGFCAEDEPEELGGCPIPPSCEDLPSDCGLDPHESCCLSLPVLGGTFDRINDERYPATVSHFRLDKYEVTVGRFRKFKAAWDGGYRPAVGSGKHTHLNGGAGLVEISGTTSHETGWMEEWASYVDTSDAVRPGPYSAWTSTPGDNETRAINFTTWFESYAFCTWDGGFLPSEAEWNYAAAGGDEQRAYPWSNPPCSTMIDCSFANFYHGVECYPGPPTAVGTTSPAGDGRYGQADLAGNVWEWILDWRAEDEVAFADACQDCFYFSSTATLGVARGGSLGYGAHDLLNSSRAQGTPDFRSGHYGFRCARTP